MRDPACVGGRTGGGSVHRRGGCSGTTLVEVIIATFILMVMAIGTGSYLYHSRAGIGIQRNRRAAIETASARLEHIRASNYADLEPSNSQTYFLSRSGGAWQLTLSDPNETAVVNGFTYPMATTVRKVTGSSPRLEYLVMGVAVGYRQGSGDRITLETIVDPDTATSGDEETLISGRVASFVPTASGTGVIRWYARTVRRRGPSAWIPRNIPVFASPCTRLSSVRFTRSLPPSALSIKPQRSWQWPGCCRRLRIGECGTAVSRETETYACTFRPAAHIGPRKPLCRITEVRRGECC